MNVSRETRARLDVYVAELKAWQRAVNLVSARSLPDVWTRHVDDCLQLVDHVGPDRYRWIDLGSGAGLPGLVLAAARPGDYVVMVESDGRKCAFLRSTAAKMDLSVQVEEGRIETVMPRLAERPTFVTARGLGPLSTLLGYARDPLSRGAVGLFLKGRSIERELTEARECWTFDAELIRSRTNPDGRICRVSDLRPNGMAPISNDGS